MDGSAARKLPRTYARHEPERTLLYQVLSREWRAWHAERQAETDRSPLPGFIERELEAFLRCGILAHGFVLVSCESCGERQPVAFSCKKRGFCPSCAGKRSAEVTAHLIDHVLPKVAYRQWVTTVPHSLRYWLAASRELTNLVHGLVTRMIMAYYEAKAEERGISEPLAGGATFIQRFGSALNINVHFHTIMLEGVYAVVEGKPVFHHLPGPTTAEVEDVVQAVAHAVIDMLRGRGLLDAEGTEVDRPACIDRDFDDSEQLQVAVAASTRMRIAFGPRAGSLVRRIGRGFGYEEEAPVALGKRCAAVNSFTIHAARYVGPQERRKLEELIAYASRGAFSHERLSLADEGEPDGDLVYELKTPWRDGTRAIVLSPGELIEKLVALVPPPYVHLSRYCGIMASHSKWRRHIVLMPHVRRGFVATGTKMEPERMSWSWLLKRTFAIDVTRCLACGTRVYPADREVVTEPLLVRAVLLALGLRPDPPPIAAARLGADDPDVAQPGYDDDE